MLKSDMKFGFGIKYEKFFHDSTEPIGSTVLKNIVHSSNESIRLKLAVQCRKIWKIKQGLRIENMS